MQSTVLHQQRATPFNTTITKLDFGASKMFTYECCSDLGCSAVADKIDHTQQLFFAGDIDITIIVIIALKGVYH